MTDALATIPNDRGSHDERKLTARWPTKAAVPAPPTDAPPLKIEGRVLAVIENYDELWSAIRIRVDEMGMTRHELDHLSGMQEGYSGKVLGPAQIKKLGPESLGATLGAICCKLILFEDPDATSKIKAIAQAYSTAADSLGMTVEKFVRIGEPQPAPSIGMTSVGKTLGGIGCKLALVEDPEATAKMLARVSKRKLPLRRFKLLPRPRAAANHEQA
jgi:hypothetical protein